MVQSTEARQHERRRRPWDGEALKAQFETASADRPWTIGYRSVGDETLLGDAKVEGVIPSDLVGTLFRNGPARHELGGRRYAHRWDGDGMIQAFHFADGAVSHRGRFVRTRKHVAETERGDFVATTFGTTVPGSTIDAEGLELANSANINVVPFDGEILALWEAGAAHRIDPNSLKTLGTKVWSEPLRHAPFSAHPKFDLDGALWNFGLDPIEERLIIYRASPGRGLVQSQVLTVPGFPPTHDFGVTARHLVFLLPSMTLDKARLQAGASFGESCQWTPSNGMRVLVVGKEDARVQELHLPAGCLFHVAQAFEGADGRLVVDYMRAEDPMSLLAGWSVMRGEYRHTAGARLTRVTLDLDGGTATQERIGEFESEFPVVGSTSGDGRSSPIVCLERAPARQADVPGFDQVAWVDTARGVRQSFCYGEDWLAEEHVPAASVSGRTPWIIGTALDMRNRQTVVSVFDPTDMAAGPVARARLSYALPLGLHGCFVS